MKKKRNGFSYGPFRFFLLTAALLHCYALPPFSPKLMSWPEQAVIYCRKPLTSILCDQDCILNIKRTINCAVKRHLYRHNHSRHKCCKFLIFSGSHKWPFFYKYIAAYGMTAVTSRVLFEAGFSHGILHGMKYWFKWDARANHGSSGIERPI